MTKQEFMAMSLPFGLKAIYTPFYEPDSVVEFGSSRYSMMLNKEYNYKPILRPISDLTKEIEHKGDVFVPIERLYHLDIMICYISLFENINLDVVYDHTFSNQYEKLLLKLVGWHFDIAGLIEKGEAIDVNTLEENPYK